MRKAILAAVVLCPVLLQAQANSPAQPQLESRLTAPAAPGTAAAKASIPANMRISTGVIPAKLIASVPVVESNNWLWHGGEAQKTAVVTLTVEADGTTSNVKVVKPIGLMMDNDVVASVSKYRFQPATLNSVAIPVEMNLTVMVAKRVQ